MKVTAIFRYQSKGVSFIRSQNIGFNEFIQNGLVFISCEQDEKMVGSRVMLGDVLLNITGASIGRVCVIPSEICPANVNQHVSIIRGNGSFDPNFLSFYISTPNFQKFIMDSQAGATRQALTKDIIENFDIPFPSLPEQKRLATFLTEKLAEVERLQKTLEEQLQAINLMPSAILRQAFNGEL